MSTQPKFEFTDKLRRSIYITWILDAHDSYIRTNNVQYKHTRDMYTKQYRALRQVNKTVRKI